MARAQVSGCAPAKLLRDRKTHESIIAKITVMPSNVGANVPVGAGGVGAVVGPDVGTFAQKIHMSLFGELSRSSRDFIGL